MEVTVDDIVLPGDIVKELSCISGKREKDKTPIILGPGLRREGETILACKAGVLRKRNPAVYYVDSYQKRYIPHQGENVIGIITQKMSDVYKVDIGAKEQAFLPFLAFQGATKKNRPDLQIGDVVFAKLLVAIKDMEPELICVDSQGKENRLGVLSSDGMLFACSLNLIRKILNPNFSLFHLLAKNQAYEVAVGMNGKIWLNTKSVKQTIAIANAILAAEYAPPTEMQELCNSIEQTLLLSK